MSEEIPPTGDTAPTAVPPPSSAPPTPPPPPPPPTKPLVPPPASRARAGIFVPRWLVVVVALVVLFAGGFGIGHWAFGSSSTTSSTASTPTTTPQASPRLSDSLALSHLIVQQPDVGSAYNVQLLGGGNQVKGQTTLDLCNGKFTTEADRVARLQDVVLDNQGNGLLSTEAVLYATPNQSAQAFAELRQVSARCPKSPVVSPVGEPTVTTRFNPPPDTHWTQTPGVERLAYSFTSIEQSGQKQASIAVYLRRGRALMGVYFEQPTGSQPKVAGQSTIPGIVGVFAARLAALPSSTVDG